MNVLDAGGEAAGSIRAPYDSIAEPWRRDRLATSFREHRFLVEHREVDDPTSRGHLAIMAVREGR